MARCNCAGGASCGCVVRAGPGVAVTGAGTGERPFVISAYPNVSGAIQFQDSSSVTFDVTGSGSQSDPYLVRAEVPGSGRYLENIGNDSSTTFVVNHGLGTRDVSVTIYENGGDYAEPDCEVRHTSTGSVTILFNTAPTTGQYRVYVRS